MAINSPAIGSGFDEEKVDSYPGAASKKTTNCTNGNFAFVQFVAGFFNTRVEPGLIAALRHRLQYFNPAKAVCYPISLQFQSRPPLNTIAFIPLLSRVRLAWGKRLAMA
jgi:hypothetical protein